VASALVEAEASGGRVELPALEVPALYRG